MPPSHQCFHLADPSSWFNIMVLKIEISSSKVSDSIEYNFHHKYLRILFSIIISYKTHKPVAYNLLWCCEMQKKESRIARGIKGRNAVHTLWFPDWRGDDGCMRQCPIIDSRRWVFMCLLCKMISSQASYCWPVYLPRERLPQSLARGRRKGKRVNNASMRVLRAVKGAARASLIVKGSGGVIASRQSSPVLTLVSGISAMCNLEILQYLWVSLSKVSILL